MGGIWRGCAGGRASGRAGEGRGGDTQRHTFTHSYGKDTLALMLLLKRGRDKGELGAEARAVGARAPSPIPPKPLPRHTRTETRCAPAIPARGGVKDLRSRPIR